MVWYDNCAEEGNPCRSIGGSKDETTAPGRMGGTGRRAPRLAPRGERLAYPPGRGGTGLRRDRRAGQPVRDRADSCARPGPGAATCCAGPAPCLERVRIYQIDTNDTWARDFGPITVRDEREPRPSRLRLQRLGAQIRRRPGQPDHPPPPRGGRLRQRAAPDGRADPRRGKHRERRPGDHPHHRGMPAGTQPQSPPLPRRDRGPAAGSSSAPTASSGWRTAIWQGTTPIPTWTPWRASARTTRSPTSAATTRPTSTTSALFMMEKELKLFRTRDGAPYRLVPLPWPAPRFDERTKAPGHLRQLPGHQRRGPRPDLPGQERRRGTWSRSGQAFPGREIIGIDCLPLILQHGSLHCVTMQLPRGTLREERGF